MTGTSFSRISALIIWRTVRIWWPVVRLIEKGRWQRLQQSFWLLIAPILVCLYLLFGAVQLLRGDQIDGLISVASSFLSMFAISIRNSWRLVATAVQNPA